MKKCLLLVTLLALVLPMTVLAQDAAAPSGKDGWIKIFNGKDLEGWKSNETGKDAGEFYVTKEGEIAGKGNRCHLYYMEELKNFELKMDVYINDKGNSGVYVHAPWVENNWPIEGFELQVNSTHTDPIKTGSIYQIISIFESPSPADTWFNYHIIVKDNRVTVKVNDKVLYEYIDPMGRDGVEGIKHISQPGYIALQQHDPGSKPKFKNIYIKKL